MQIKITSTEEQIAVVTPYSVDFVARCRDLGGKWDAANKAWKFPVALKDDVLEALNDCYGYVADARQERITLKVTVHCEQTEGKGPVKFGPYELAHARGRDSGARPGLNVALISGTIGSGGSVKNWVSWVKAGAVFKLVDVPLSVAERLREIAIAETYTAYERVDEVERAIPDGKAVWQIEDDGIPAGLVRRASKAAAGGECYRWFRTVEKPVFVVEEV